VGSGFEPLAPHQHIRLSAVLSHRSMPAGVPWVTFLPDADFDAFVTELADVARGAAVGDVAPVAVCLTQWRHSAEVYADPVLLEILTREPESDLGPVSAPKTSD
jgi:hypothetical protein